MAEHEIIADIVAEKRRLAEYIRKNLSTVYVRRLDEEAEIRFLEGESNRLEAALKRECGDVAKLREALAEVRVEAYECDQGGEYLGVKDADGNVILNVNRYAFDGKNRIERRMRAIAFASALVDLLNSHRERMELK